jgi:glycosyltransferase involved in cell wall biosynthesis
MTRKKKFKILSVIIPVYNEQYTLKKILDKVIKSGISLKKEVICVDDGSTDNSFEILKEYKKKYPGIVSVYHKDNEGKGSAVKYGLGKAKGDIFIIQDADLEYDPRDYNRLIRFIEKGRYEVVFGSRYLPNKKRLPNENHFFNFGNYFLSWLTTLLYGHKITDMETCYKLFTRDVYKKLDLKSDKFNIEAEITAKILIMKYPIKEIPITYAPRTSYEGKKATWKDGVDAFFSLLILRFRG